MKKYPLFLFCAVLASASWHQVQALEVKDAVADCALNAIKDNESFQLGKLRGKVVYIDFWASWCGPCAKSFPFLNGLHNQFKDRGLTIIGVNLDENRSDAEAFLSKYPAEFTVAVDKQAQCADSFSVKAMPSSYLVDANGIIRHVHLGFRPEDAKNIQAVVEQLLAGPVRGDGR